MIFLLELKSKKNTEIERISKRDYSLFNGGVFGLFSGGGSFIQCGFFQLEHVQGHQLQKRDLISFRLLCFAHEHKVDFRFPPPKKSQDDVLHP